MKSIFQRYYENEIDAKKAKELLILKKIQTDRKSVLEKLDFLSKSIDLYEKRSVQSSVTEVLAELQPMIVSNNGIKEALSDESVDISRSAAILIKKFRTKYDLASIAGLIVLSIAARLEPERAAYLIQQARALAQTPKPKEVK